jgi:cyclic beta-1,2-glucan synthetase
VAVAFAAILLIVLLRLPALPIAAPFLLAWTVSPLVAFLVSRRHIEQVRELPTRERGHGRSVARRTWRFFQTFVGDEDHWLPPDNVQEEPQVIAHRTSPTNIGLLLLATLSAYDFGYIGLVELIERLEFTFATLEKLQQFRGHFFNWHDTRTLQPMWPHYVSVVDSGNLCGHLIAVRQACLETEAGRGGELAARLQAIADRAYDYAKEMDFRFLYDRHSMAFRRRWASAWSSRYMNRGRARRNASSSGPGTTAQRSRLAAITSAVGASPVRTDVSPKKSPGPSVHRASPSTEIEACPSRMTKNPLPLRP